MSILVVGGTWFESGGKASKVFNDLYIGIKSVFDKEDQDYYNLDYYNGGGLELLDSLSKQYSSKITFWMPNISNDINEKFIEIIKKRNQHVILIGSKRLDERDIGLPEIIDRMLVTKMNLCLLIDKDGDKFTGKIIDPLGNLFGSGTDFCELGKKLAERALYLSRVKRVGSSQITNEQEMPKVECDPEFFNIIHEWAEIFDKLVPRPKQVNRFLGNAAFRCSYGFPAFRGHDELIYVSRRNVDKSGIGINDFVPVKPFEYYDGEVKYYGDIKPSVDTPVNLLLFKHFPNINYMIHGHVYIKSAPITSKAIPCGAVEEFEEIIKLNDINTWNIFNLKGHGCIFIAESIRDIRSVNKEIFYARPTLEE